MFAKAVYLLKEKRQRESKTLPKKLLQKIIFGCLNKTISIGLKQFSVKATSTRKEYVKLLARVNATRGSEVSRMRYQGIKNEVSRMKIQDYMDRNSWISESIDTLTEDGT